MAVLTVETGNKRSQVRFEAPKLLDDLLEEAGFRLPHPCGGQGTCGKCSVGLEGEVSAPNDAEIRVGTRLCCQAVVLGDAKVTLAQRKEISQIQSRFDRNIKMGTPVAGSTGAAVDIGTTTVVLKYYDLRTGALLGESAMENPQTLVAADIMGRIEAAMNGKLEALQRQLLEALSELMKQAGGKPDVMVITGNTTMLYLLTGRDPSCLSRIPFEADTLFDGETQILGINTYLPPCMNAFVGADITCAVMASDLCAHQTALLCDIGTNGEIALWKDNVLYVTSTAAGPVFEGAGISCGCSSIPGAVDRVWSENGEVKIHTIGDVPAVGLCGSGVIDAVAQLLDLERMEETGFLEGDLELGQGVVLRQKDIRSVQMAKAAIAAGIETLLEVSDTSCDQIETLYLAGGFGSHLNIRNAVRIGLLPRELEEKVQTIGNGALAGAVRIMLDKERVRVLREITARSKRCDLGGNPKFNENYVNNMFFPVE